MKIFYNDKKYEVENNITAEDFMHKINKQLYNLLSSNK